MARLSKLLAIAILLGCGESAQNTIAIQELKDEIADLEKNAIRLDESAQEFHLEAQEEHDGLFVGELGERHRVEFTKKAEHAENTAKYYRKLAAEKKELLPQIE